MVSQKENNALRYTPSGKCFNVGFMCIAGSVGRGGRNRPEDVRTVQLLLNMHQPQVVGPLVPDGVCGDATIVLIEHFQRGVIGGKDQLGFITPNGEKNSGTTLEALRNGMPPGFVEEKLEAILIHSPATEAARFFAPLLAGMQVAQIDTPLRQAHFLAQIGHESGELRYTEEIASGAAYENRKDLGNTQPGDGKRFKGRGLIQVTGRANYQLFGKAIGIDLLAKPECVATDPRLAVDASTWFWNAHNLNRLADADDIMSITKRINGGTNGLADRKEKLMRAKWFLMEAHPDASIAGLIRAMEAVGLVPTSRKHSHRTHRRKKKHGTPDHRN